MTNYAVEFYIIVSKTNQLNLIGDDISVIKHLFYNERSTFMFGNDNFFSKISWRTSGLFSRNYCFLLRIIQIVFSI